MFMFSFIAKVSSTVNFVVNPRRDDNVLLALGHNLLMFDAFCSKTSDFVFPDTSLITLSTCLALLLLNGEASSDEGFLGTTSL